MADILAVRYFTHLSGFSGSFHLPFLMSLSTYLTYTVFALTSLRLKYVILSSAA